MMRTRWKAGEGAFFAILTVAFASLAIRMDAEPTAVFFGAATLLLVYFGVDLREVELANWVTISFGDRSQSDESAPGADCEEDSRE